MYHKWPSKKIKNVEKSLFLFIKDLLATQLLSKYYPYTIFLIWISKSIHVLVIEWITEFQCIDLAAVENEWNGVVFLDIPGTLVPRATTEIAVIESLSPTVQPNSVARSCINMVSTPIMMMLTLKQAQPPR